MMPSSTTGGAAQHRSTLTVCASSDTTRSRVRPVGELDVDTAEQLTAALAELDGRQLITVDLSGVTFLGAAGLNMPATAATARRRSSGQLRVTGVRPFHRQWFTITGLADLLDPR